MLNSGAAASSQVPSPSSISVVTAPRGKISASGLAGRWPISECAELFTASSRPVRPWVPSSE